MLEEVDEDPADLEETDSDKEEAGGFNEDAGGFDEKEGGFNEEGEVFDEEEVAQDSDFERRGKDSDIDGVVYKEGENIGKAGEMRNSKDFGLEHVPNMQEEPSIIDSMSLND